MNVLDHFPFETYRPYQKETILECVEKFDSGYKNIIIESPTGSGKSAMAISIGMYYDSTFLLTSQKILQEQYVKDFSSDNFCLIKGRNNYQCLMDKNLTCDDVSIACKDAYCPMKKDCLYEIAKSKAIAAKIALMNYKYFLLSKNHTESFGNRKLIIYDEAHNLDKEIMSFVEFSFNSTTLSKLKVTAKVPTFDTTKEYVEWIKKIYKEIEVRIKEVAEKVKNPENDRLKETYQKDLENLKNYALKINRFLDTQETIEWVFDLLKSETDSWRSISFKPLTVEYFADEFLFKHSEIRLFMSATILSKTQFCKNLGLNIKETHFIQTPSTFSPDIRPIWITRSGKMGMKDIDKTLPVVVEDIRKILDENKGVKGLIHCHTFKIAKYIEDHIEERVLFHDSETREDVLKEFMESTEPKVLVTPSMTEGIDLKDDLARFVVIVKLPFLFLGDKQIKRRMEMDGDWYSWKTALTIIQAAGRAVRHDNDRCTIYIMDSQFDSFLYRNKQFFPQYFIDAIKN